VKSSDSNMTEKSETKVSGDGDVSEDDKLVTLIEQMEDVETLRKTIREIPPADRLDIISEGKHNGKTLMYHAVEKRCVEALQLLADFVCDPNIPCTEKNRTCLHRAVELEDEKMCEIIIYGFAKTDLQDEDGKVAYELHPKDPFAWSGKLKMYRTKFDLWMRESMSTFIDIDEAQNYRRTFDCFDASGDGQIDKSEMRKLLFALLEDKPTEADLTKFYEWFDKDNNGLIEWKEFLCAIVNGFQQDEALRKKKKKRKKKKGKGGKGRKNRK